MTLRDVVAEAAAGQTRGFRASYVSRRTGRSLGDVQRELAGMVRAGELDILYELLCPDTGRLIKRFTATQPLPIGQTIERDDCEDFEVGLESFWVTYKPTADLAMDILRKATDPGKVQARRSLLRRALQRMAIGLIVTHTSNQA